MTSRLPESLQSLIAALRRRVRAYVWTQGLCLTAAWLALAFWITLGIDRAFEPPPAVRLAMLAIVAAVALGIFWWFVLRRTFVPLADHSMAILLERRFAGFGDSLLTAVHLSEHPEGVNALNEEMLEHASRQAMQGAGQVRLGAVFNFRPLAIALAAVLLLAGTVAALAVNRPQTVAVWQQRVLGMSEQLWPRTTRLVVEGFDSGGVRKVARGADFALLVQADANMIVPESVTLEYQTDDGTHHRQYMTQYGVAPSGADAYQEYKYDFERLHESLNFSVYGGDDAVRDLRIEVVDSPTVSGMTLHLVYPSYMPPPRERMLEVAGQMQIPVGTRVTLQATANKPLVRIYVTSMGAGGEGLGASDAQADPTAGHQTTRHQATRQPDTSAAKQGFATIDLAGAPTDHFELTIDRLLEDTTLLFELTDTDGITSRQPLRLALAARPDEAPQVAVRLSGIGTAITPAARVPIVGKITDDWGVERAWFEFGTSPTDAHVQDFSLPEGGRVDQVALDVGAFEPQLKAGDKLLLTVKAADRFDVEGKPNVGSSPREQLDVVTLDQLRVLLDTRELLLRRRLETILDELSDTRDTLARVAPAEPSPPTDEDGASNAPAESAGIADDVDDPANNKPAQDDPAKGGELPMDGAESQLTAAEARARRATQTERVVQNCERSRYETLELAAAFDDIAEEYTNNRIYDVDQQDRLKVRIATRLRQIGQDRFPQLQDQLKRLQQQLDDPQQTRTTVADCGTQLDAILVEMRGVLGEMKDVAQMAELLAAFRQLLDDQNALTKQTEEEKARKEKELLEGLEGLDLEP